MQNVLRRVKGLTQGHIKTEALIKRWPSNPKVAFFGPPNVFIDELSQR